MEREELINSHIYKVTTASIEKYNSYQQEERNDLDYMDGFEDGANWQKAEIINKACEWLRNYFCFEHEGMTPSGFAVFSTKFKKAMDDKDENKI